MPLNFKQQSENYLKQIICGSLENGCIKSYSRRFLVINVTVAFVVGFDRKGLPAVFMRNEKKRTVVRLMQTAMSLALPYTINVLKIASNTL